MSQIVYKGIQYGADTYVKVDNSVFSNKNLTDGAVVLYVFLVDFTWKNKPISDNYIIKSLGISKATLYRRKAELMEEDLLDTVQIGTRHYMWFLGTKALPASVVSAGYKCKEGVPEGEIRINVVGSVGITEEEGESND